MIDGVTSGVAGQAGQAGHAAHKRPSAAEIFKKLDKDGDGGISLEELQSAKKNGKGPDASAIMAKFDANKDGKIDEQENEKALAKMREDFKKHCPPPDEVQETGSANDPLKSLLDILKKKMSEAKGKGGASQADANEINSKLMAEIQRGFQYSASGSGTNSVSQGLLSVKV